MTLLPRDDSISMSHTRAHPTHTHTGCSKTKHYYGGTNWIISGTAILFLLSSQTHVTLKSAFPRTGGLLPVAGLTFGVYNEALVSLQ